MVWVLVLKFKEVVLAGCVFKFPFWEEDLRLGDFPLVWAGPLGDVFTKSLKTVPEGNWGWFESNWLEATLDFLWNTVRCEEFNFL